MRGRPLISLDNQIRQKLNADSSVSSLRALLLAAVLTGGVSLDAAAQPFTRNDHDRVLLAQFQVPQNSILPGKPRSRVGSQMAASMVKQRFPDSKILAVKHDPGKSQYRIKLLTSGGVLKYVYVDARDGEVFE